MALKADVVVDFRGSLSELGHQRPVEVQTKCASVDWIHLTLERRPKQMSERLNQPGDLLQFVAAARRAADADIWFAALPLALTLPDICGAVDDPGVGRSKKRYVAWWDANMAHRYWVQPDADETPQWEPFTYLPGDDAYALRCAYLHSGTNQASHGDERSRRVRFLGPPTAKAFGYDPKSQTLYVGLEQFVEWVCQAVEQWLRERTADEVAQGRLRGLVSIVPSAIRHPGREHQP